MAVSVDVSIQYRGYNTIKLVGVSRFTCYPYGVQGLETISHGLYVYSTSGLVSAVRGRTRFIGANGLTVSTVNHSFAVTQGVFTWVKIEAVPVPSTAIKADFEILNTTGTYWAGLIKSEAGKLATDYTQNPQGQLTLITAKGIYTGSVQAGQIMLSSGETLSNRLVTINESLIKLSDSNAVLDGKVFTATNSITALGNRILAVEIVNNTQNTRMTNMEAGQITLSSSTNGTIAGLTLTSSTLRATSGAYGVQISGNSTAAPIWVGDNTFKIPKFYVGWNGVMHAIGAEVSGKITATSGQIGGFSIENGYIESKNGSYACWLSGSPSWAPIWVGNSSYTTSKFRVEWDGAMYSTAANISGKITATSGQIGGFSIESNLLRATNGEYGLLLCGSSASVPIWVGNSTFNSPQFFVNWAGRLTANEADIKGTIRAGSVINGSLNGTVGLHVGEHVGYHEGQAITNGYSSLGGSLNAAGGSFYGNAYSPSGTLGGSGYQSYDGNLKFNNEVRFQEWVTCHRGMTLFADINCHAKINSIDGKVYLISDRNAKKNIRDVDPELLSNLLNLRIKNFEYKALPDERQVGVIAQEVIESTSAEFCDMYVRPHDGSLNINYTGMIPLLILAYQDHSHRLQQLERRMKR